MGNKATRMSKDKQESKVTNRRMAIFSTKQKIKELSDSLNSTTPTSSLGIVTTGGGGGGGNSLVVSGGGTMVAGGGGSGGGGDSEARATLQRYLAVVQQQLDREGKQLIKADLVAILFALRQEFRAMHATIDKYTVTDLNALIRVTVFDTDYLRGNPGSPLGLLLPAGAAGSQQLSLAGGGGGPAEWKSEYGGGYG